MCMELEQSLAQAADGLVSEPESWRAILILCELPPRYSDLVREFFDVDEIDLGLTIIALRERDTEESRALSFALNWAYGISQRVKRVYFQE